MALTLRNVVNRALEFYEFDGNLQFVEQKALEAQAARDAAVLFSNVFDSTALGIAGTTNGQYFTVPGTGGVYLYLYKNVSGVATLSATLNAFVGGTLTGALNEAPPVTIASAANIDIGAAASNTVIISGTTAITSLGTIAAGAIRYLQATGAFTLTHNAASLILPGGANITTADGDVAVMLSMGSGNWRCISYHRASGTAGVSGALNIPHTWAVAGEVKVPVGDADVIPGFFVPSLAPGQTAKLVEARHKIGAGTSATVKLQKNGVDITGFTGISVTTTDSLTNPTDVTLAAGDYIQPIVTAVSGTPKNLTLTVALEYVRA